MTSRQPPPPWYRRRVRLSMLLLYVNLIVVVMPILGVGVLRIYENELIRRTEASLIAQGAFIRAAYLGHLQRADGFDLAGWSHAPAPEHAPGPASKFEHVPTRVDINITPMLGPAPDPRVAPHATSAQLLDLGLLVSPLMTEAQRVTLAGMRVVDHRGVVVASSRGELEMSLAHREEVERALQGEYFRLLRQRISDEPKPSITSLSRRSDMRLFVSMPMVMQGQIVGAVIVSRTPSSLTRALHENRYVLIAFALTLLFAVLALSFYTSFTIVRPVQALIRQADEVADGDAAAMRVLESPVTYEFEQLSEAIVHMARALDERADYIKTFASNVSHEFKTPLTSIRGTVELLEDHLDTMTEEERARFISMIDRDAERLQRLVDRLLELARADVFQPGAQTIQPALLLRAIQTRYEREDAQVTLDIAPEVAFVRMAKVTLDSIVSNLMDNARQHAGATSPITIWARVEEGDLVIEVRDQGPGVSEGNRARIFDPFFTTARDDGGTGLGLSVIRSLLEAHDGAIRLHDGLPTTFEIRLPHVQEPS